MAAFRDQVSLTRAVRASAIPTLEVLEANPAWLDRSRRRFDRESPPPYTSSTEEESEPDPEHVSDPVIRQILDEPLSEAELDTLGDIAVRRYPAGSTMWAEYKAEFEHLHTYSDVYGLQPSLTRKLKYRICKQRLHILARSGLRRRWQALGIWNNDWGAVDCTKARSHDVDFNCVVDDDGNPFAWDWDEKDMPHDRTHPAWRAVLLRAGLYRDECYVPPPRRTPTSESSTSEKESFITSRPWFQFAISTSEENIRCLRLSNSQLQYLDQRESPYEIVRKRWERAGLWKPIWDRQRPDTRAGWKWHHESPSPEPEDYANYDPDAMGEHLSPSELDEYERIVPTPPNTPPRALWPFWFPEEEKDRPIWKTPPPPEYRETAVTPSPAPPKSKSKPKPAKKRIPAPRRTQASRPPARAQKPRPTKNSTTSAASAASAEPRRSARIAARQAQGAQKELLADEEDARKQQQRRTQRKTKTTQSQAKTAQSKAKTTQSEAKTTQSKTKTTQRARGGGVAAAAKKETAKNAKAPAQSRKRKRK